MEMSTCAQCNTALPPIHGKGIGLRFCGVKCCREYHGTEIERRVRDDTPPFTAQELQQQFIVENLKPFTAKLAEQKKGG